MCVDTVFGLMKRSFAIAFERRPAARRARTAVFQVYRVVI
jgi:hypothetical protein